ncbi:hypothetical protein [Defluviimonas salinarum]|uniref:HD domain-containing protein n=1 Tax=Defluviimonas salinarum TaxID=2992147 RepID=A0ABT3J4C4_9RHOB|nr:hypothetical protein [Defluviimonas salinarum]MCW3782521.1 hypothetical protein [Defluviimonas salinarum]
MEAGWTRLEGGDLWGAARAAHEADTHRRYHAFAHPLAMYRHAAETFGFSYDRHLDRAILTHDVVHDGGPDVELRSALWLRKRLDTPDPEAEAMIRATIDHVPGRDNRIILLDLADFMFPEVRRENTRLLAEEARLLHGWDGSAFADRSAAHLDRLEVRIRDGIPGIDSPREREWFAAIAEGIRAAARDLRAPCPSSPDF